MPQKLPAETAVERTRRPGAGPVEGSLQTGSHRTWGHVLPAHLPRDGAPGGAFQTKPVPCVEGTPRAQNMSGGGGKQTGPGAASGLRHGRGEQAHEAGRADLELGWG